MATAKEPEESVLRAAEESEDEWPEDGGDYEDGEEDESGDDFEEEDIDFEEFVVNGTPLTQEQLKRESHRPYCAVDKAWNFGKSEHRPSDRKSTDKTHTDLARIHCMNM